MKLQGIFCDRNNKKGQKNSTAGKHLLFIKLAWILIPGTTIVLQALLEKIPELREPGVNPENRHV